MLFDIVSIVMEILFETLLKIPPTKAFIDFIQCPPLNHCMPKLTFHSQLYADAISLKIATLKNPLKGVY